LILPPTWFQRSFSLSPKVQVTECVASTNPPPSAPRRLPRCSRTLCATFFVPQSPWILWFLCLLPLSHTERYKNFAPINPIPFPSRPATYTTSLLTDSLFRSTLPTVLAPPQGVDWSPSGGFLWRNWSYSFLPYLSTPPPSLVVLLVVCILVPDCFVFLIPCSRCFAQSRAGAPPQLFWSHTFFFFLTFVSPC